MFHLAVTDSANLFQIFHVGHLQQQHLRQEKQQPHHSKHLPIVSPSALFCSCCVVTWRSRTANTCCPRTCRCSPRSTSSAAAPNTTRASPTKSCSATAPCTTPSRRCPRCACTNTSDQTLSQTQCCFFFCIFAKKSPINGCFLSMFSFPPIIIVVRWSVHFLPMRSELPGKKPRSKSKCLTWVSDAFMENAFFRVWRRSWTSSSRFL